MPQTSGEGNGTPLQYSCLENPMDGGAWQAAVHGAAKSRTTSDFTFTFHFHALAKEMATHWRIPGRFNPNGESQGRGSLVGCLLWGRTESDTTEAAQHSSSTKYLVWKKKKALDTTLFPHRALTDQFGYSCDNVFVIIKWTLTTLQGSTDHGAVKAQSTLPSQQLTPTFPHCYVFLAYSAVFTVLASSWQLQKFGQ